MAEKQAAKRKHMEAFVERFRAKASKARQAQSRLKALEKMAQVDIAIDSDVQPIRLPSPERQPASPIIAMEGVERGLRGRQADARATSGPAHRCRRPHRAARRQRQRQIDLRQARGQTAWQPMGGKITRADKLKIAMFAQHQLDDLVPEQTPYDHVRALMAGPAGIESARPRRTDRARRRPHGHKGEGPVRR